MFNIEEDDMGTTRKWAQGRRLRSLTTTLVLAVLAALLLAGNAFAAPGRPTAKTPNATSTVITTTPTFKWSRAARAATYEVRVYKGSALQVKKTGITGLSWKSSKTLAMGVTYSWKVRGRKAGVNGPWSNSLKFAGIVLPPVDPALIASWSENSMVGWSSLYTFRANRTFLYRITNGSQISTTTGSYSTSAGSIRFFNQIEDGTPVAETTSTYVFLDGGATLLIDAVWYYHKI